MGDASLWGRAAGIPYLADDPFVAAPRPASPLDRIRSGRPGYSRVEHATADGTARAILRRAEQLRNGRFAVGVEVLPNRIHAVLVDQNGERIGKRQRHLVTMDPVSLSHEISDVATGLVRTELGIDLPSGNVVIGLQIGAPVDSQRGLVLHYRNHVDEPLHAASPVLWPGPVPLAEQVQAETGCRTVVENDGAAYAVYERRHGGHDTPSFAVVIIRDGVGGGLILDRQVLAIPFEIGHLNVRGNDRACLCGRSGCIEAVAGRRAMTAVVAERVGSQARLDFVALTQGDLASSPEVVEVFREAGEAVAQGIGAILTMFGIKLVVVYHDEVMADADSGTPATAAFRDGVATFREHTFPPLRDCRLETRPLRPTVGAHGAALIALNRLSFVPLP